MQKIIDLDFVRIIFEDFLKTWLIPQMGAVEKYPGVVKFAKEKKKNHFVGDN